MNEPFVVTGATGNTGSVVAEALLQAGHPVRVVVRDAAKGERLAQRGAEVVVADLEDVSTLTDALRGARSAWLLVPPKPTSPDVRAEQHRIVESIVAATEAAGLPHAAFLSSIGAQHESGTGPIAGLHEVEVRLPKVTKVAFVRAAYFMENLGGSLSMLEEGKLPSFFPAGFPIEMVATQDIGRVAAQAMLEESSGVIELSGGKKTMQDVARALSTLIGKRVEVLEAPLAAVVPTLTSAGLSSNMAELYREMIEGIRDGRVAFEGTHRRARGEVPLEQVLRGLIAP